VRIHAGRSRAAESRSSNTIAIAINNPSAFQYVSGWSRRAPALSEWSDGTMRGTSRVASA
jgi:hypothetical protein